MFYSGRVAAPKQEEKGDGFETYGWMFTLLDINVEYFFTEDSQRGSRSLKNTKIVIQITAMILRIRSGTPSGRRGTFAVFWKGLYFCVSRIFFFGWSKSKIWNRNIEDWFASADSYFENCFLFLSDASSRLPLSRCVWRVQPLFCLLGSQPPPSAQSVHPLLQREKIMNEKLWYNSTWRLF